MTNTMYYRLAAGVDVVPIGDDAYLFRSNTLAVRIEGSMAVLLGRRVIPLLQQARSVDELSPLLADVPARALQQGLESLVDARVLERSEQLAAPAPDHPLTAFVADMGIAPAEARQRLRAARIAIFGLEAHGAHLALELGRLGVGTCILADSFRMAETDTLLMPAMANGTGRSRQETVAELLSVHAPSTRVTLAGELSRDAVRRLADQSSLLIGCFDRGFETAQHWINRAAIASQRPALFADIRTHVATIGPHVAPGESACYMCYRMRRIACEENYDEAMAHERFLNERRMPALSSRATATFLAGQRRTMLAGEGGKPGGRRPPPPPPRGG